MREETVFSATRSEWQRVGLVIFAIGFAIGCLVGGVIVVSLMAYYYY